MTGRTTQGFGLSAETVSYYCTVHVLSVEEFDNLITQNEPTGHHTIGFNQGAPRDGLVEGVYRGTQHHNLVGGRIAYNATGAGRYPVAVCFPA